MATRILRHRRILCMLVLCFLFPTSLSAQTAPAKPSPIQQNAITPKGQEGAPSEAEDTRVMEACIWVEPDDFEQFLARFYGSDNARSPDLVDLVLQVSREDACQTSYPKDFQDLIAEKGSQNSGRAADHSLAPVPFSTSAKPVGHVETKASIPVKTNNKQSNFTNHRDKKIISIINENSGNIFIGIILIIVLISITISHYITTGKLDKTHNYIFNTGKKLQANQHIKPPWLTDLEEKIDDVRSLIPDTMVPGDDTSSPEADAEAEKSAENRSASPPTEGLPHQSEHQHMQTNKEWYAEISSAYKQITRSTSDPRHLVKLAELFDQQYKPIHLAMDGTSLYPATGVTDFWAFRVPHNSRTYIIFPADRWWHKDYKRFRNSYQSAMGDRVLDPYFDVQFADEYDYGEVTRPAYVTSEGSKYRLIPKPNSVGLLKLKSR
ncbi:hypothetical protein [Magnetospira sp. QH-2]|uniref:hypothetical protein n=1 Tax=Magnetospira sp. (strain QH-2) TaxID=1288970 RepID=UPI0003E80B35|nr:hypothetical protein [Magnetospira sp. QH-2]CCQ73198.1 Exported protein of unknown function [Magnetospira sp. QH-2]